jgi:hypothetical protein
MYTAPTGRSLERRQQEQEQDLNALLTKRTDAMTIQRQQEVTKKWSCDECQRVFDDFQTAARHEDACKLKKRLQRLDDLRSEQKASLSEKSASFSTGTTATNAYANPVLPQMKNEAREEPLSVPRTIHVHNSFRQQQQAKQQQQSEMETATSSSFGTHSYSTGQFQQGFESANVCSAVGYSSGVPLSSTGYRQRRKSRPVYTTYIPPESTSYNREVADIRDDKILKTNYESSPPAFAAVGQTYGLEDARDDISASHLRRRYEFHSTRMPTAKDVRVIGRGLSDHSSDVITASREASDAEMASYDDDQHPKKSMKWLCDVCKEAQFENYVEAFRHEMNCRKKFFLEQQQRESVMAHSEPDRFYAEQRAQRREKLKQQWQAKSRSIYSKIDSIPGASAPPPIRDTLETRGVDSGHGHEKGEGTKKWLCSICKQQYFEHYLDACRHERQCIQMQQQQQQHFQPMSMPRPSLRNRREGYV